MVHTYSLEPIQDGVRLNQWMASENCLQRFELSSPGQNDTVLVYSVLPEDSGHRQNHFDSSEPYFFSNTPDFLSFPRDVFCDSLIKTNVMPRVEVAIGPCVGITSHFVIQVSQYEVNCDRAATPASLVGALPQVQQAFLLENPDAWEETTVTLYQGYWDDDDILDYVVQLKVGDFQLGAYKFSLDPNQTVVNEIEFLQEDGAAEAGSEG